MLQVKPEKVVVVEEPIPTFAEQIRPLVEAAAARTLSAREKGSLELLLLHFWRERASLHDSDMVSAIRQLRAHPDAGNLLSSVERWLHQSDGAHDARDRSPEAIVELLKPYAEMAAISTPIKGFAMGQGSATVSKDPQSNARSAAR